MDDAPDRTTALDRSRLCEVGEIDRAKHIRWTQARLLREKPRYGELDLIRAVVLDELTKVLKPKNAGIAWGRIQNDIDHPGQRLEVVFSVATTDAILLRTGGSLDGTLPRNEPIFLVPLHDRIARARQRLATFRSGGASVSSPAQLGTPGSRRVAGSRPEALSEDP
jgi:hypothetical protein